MSPRVPFACALVLATVSLVPAAGAPELCPPGNLLRLDGVRADVARVVDGRFAPEGADPARNAVPLDSELRIDLGSRRTVRAVMVQASHDDVYTVEGSSDGVSWSPLAVARGQEAPGLRSRAMRLSRPAEVRLLRVTASGGDGDFQLAQVAAWCRVPERPPTAEPGRPVSQAGLVRGAKLVLALLGLGLFAWGAIVRRGGRPELARRGRDAALAVLGLAAGLAWWNFGGFNSGRHVHVWDQFHYFLGGKYFPELGYDLLYECVTLADVEDGLGERVRSRTLRDMASNRSVPAMTVLEHPDRCKARFEPARWEAFRSDVGWFRGRLHPELWERIFLDHGYNAPPAWTIVGGTLTRWVPANETTILLLSLVDPALLLLMWAVVVWAFGWRAACVGLLWWGTNQMATFGWTGGGLLRQDWLVLTVVGICLARRRHALAAGFALGYATLLRVFPGLIVAALVLQVVARSLRAGRIVVTRDHWKLLAGFLAAMIVLVPLAATTAGGLDSWSSFIDNSRANLRATGVNMVGLMVLLTYDHDLRKEAMLDREDPGWEDRWREANRALFRARRPLLWLLFAGFLPLLAWALRDEEAWVALALGIGLIPIGLFVACYYYGFLLGCGLLHRRLGDGAGVVLCALSVATHVGQWLWGARIQMDTRFAWDSLAVLIAVLALTILVGRGGRLVGPRPPKSGSPASIPENVVETAHL